MIPVRQSTAFETAVGPVLDADGVAVTDCVVGDFKLKKTTGNFAALNGSATLTHVSAGMYDLVLTTSDTDTVGLCCVAIDDTVNACASIYLQVMEEAIYDALYAASANTFTGAAGSNAVRLVDLTTTTTTATNLTNAPTNGDLTATMKTSVTTAATAATPTAAAVTGNVGGNVTGSVGSVLGGINTSGGTITTLDGLDTAQDTQHGTTQTYLTNNLGTAGAAATEAGGTGDHLTALSVTLKDGAHGGTSATLRLGGSTSTPAFYVTNSGGDAAKFESTGGNGIGLHVDGDGSGAGLRATGGATGNGGHFSGGASGGNGLRVFGASANALHCEVDANDLHAAYFQGQRDGHGIYAVGGNGDGTGTGHGIIGASLGTGKGLFAATAQFTTFTVSTNDIAWNAAWDAEVQSEVADGLTAFGWSSITISAVSGAVGSVTGAVGSVTGNVGGNVAGSVGSVTGNVGGNVTGSIGSLATQAKADVNAEVDSALDTAIPGTPTSNSINERLQTMDNAYTATRAGYLDNINNSALQTTSAQTGDAYARLGAPTGASVSADIADVESKVDDLEGRLTSARAGYLDNLSAGAVALETTAQSILADTGTDGVVVNTFTTAGKAELQTEANDALVANHLDHLLAADYDPASKPGVSTALLNELVESDSGVSRFTANALEQAPSSSGGDATAANQTTIINHLVDIKGTGFSTSTDSLKILSDEVDLIGGSAGSGANSVTITWTDNTAAPVPDGDVWITSDSAGNNVVAGTLQTNSMGRAVFLLDAGSTYYLWAAKDGINPIKGQQFVAVAD